MPPKRKAASKPKKAEQIAIEEDMSRVTVRRPLKNNDENLKGEEQEVEPLQEDISEHNSNMNAMVVLEKIPDTGIVEQEFEVADEDFDSNKKSVLKKNVLSLKITKSESKKKTIEDGKVSKKIRKRAASEEKQTNEEKVVSSKNKKRQVDKDSHLNEPQKRNRRAASVDVLTKNSSSVVVEPKKIRKVKKGSTVETTEDLMKRQKSSSSLDSLNMNISPEAVPKKIRKGTKPVETVDKTKKNQKVIKKKEPKTQKKILKEEKTTNKVVIDEKENIDLLPTEENNIAEKIDDKVKSTIALTKGQMNEELEIQDDPKEVPKQINSRSRGKRQVAQKVISKPNQHKSSEESSRKTDSDDSDVLIIDPEQPTEEQDVELKEDSPKETPKQIKSKSHGKRQGTQKQYLKKTNKSSEESSGKSNTDDSDMAKSPDIKPKRNGKQKETNIDHEIKLPKRQARNARNVKFEEEEEEEILGSDEILKTGALSDNNSDTPESEKKLAPTVVKRRAKAKPSKK